MTSKKQAALSFPQGRLFRFPGGKTMDLSEFFQTNPRAASAFSGGVDSAYLLYAALRSGADVTAYCVCSAFQPDFEREDAVRVAAGLGAALRLLPLDVLSVPEIAENPPERCYFCKKRVFTAIAAAAREDGYALLLDGTNASDDAADRPGMRALRELSVRSPLRECGLGKTEIRARARSAGLSVWDKPAYACLATRIRTGERLTAENLAAVARAEHCLRTLGFSDFRVRSAGGDAKIQLRESQLGALLEHRAAILRELKKDFQSVTLDLEVRG
jgi:uncharacterized protein